MYENALEFLKDQVARNTSSEEKRAGLINILGEESIGFWVILDQIIFYEDLVVEIKQLAQMTGRASSQQTGASSTPQQRAYWYAKQHEMESKRWRRTEVSDMSIVC